MKINRFLPKARASLLWPLLLGLLLPLAFITNTVQAERSFQLQQIVIEGEVLPDASMRVTEKITIDFSGQWKGFFISIPQGNTPIKEVQVHENGQEYAFNPGKAYGPPGTFLVKDQSDKILIDWSLAAKDERRTFDVSYRVMNAVKIHNDVAELYRKFIGDGNQEKVGVVKVTLKLPAGAENYEHGKDIRIWGHGPLNGEVNFTDVNVITWQIKDLPAHKFMEGRVVMPVALYPNAERNVYTGQTALPSILSEETDWAQEANRKRWLARLEIGAAIAIILGAGGGVFLLWRKYGRRYRVQFDGTYYRERPSDYSPAELSILWNYEKVKAQDITATMLDLARRKFLRIEEEYVERRNLWGTKEVKTYRLTFLPAPDPATCRKPEEAMLRIHEQDLLNYLVNRIAGGRGFLYLNDIENFAKTNGEDFSEFWKGWTRGLREQGEDLNFFDHSGNMPVITIVGGLILFIAGSAVINEKTILGAALLGAGTIIGVIPRLFKRRSASGQEDFVRWQGFRRFLLDFSQMQKHEIPSLILWEHYLIYAVTLGVAREVIKQLELVFPNMQDGDYRFGYGWYLYRDYTGFKALHDCFHDIGNIMERSITTVQAASKSSSDSGDGGGFSSGGGGGGGGSSYGGR